MKVAVVMGSDSDWKVMKAAKDVMTEFGVEVHAEVVSAHRTPEDLEKFTTWAKNNNIKVIIAGAGGAAHLPGMLASYTTLPVIGVPVNTNAMNGMDSLLSIVQMPKGIPVATVAIDNSTNAALLAIRILATHNSELDKKLVSYRQKLAEESRQKNHNLK
jgi:5-(carboxyamino)imidazole ribonucleotide mutase